MKRVIHVVPALFSRDDGVIGGAERYVFELARHMADILPTSLVTFGEREREERVGALRIRVIGQPWYVRGQQANPIARPLFDEIRKADVIHCHQQHIVAATVSAIVGRLLGRRVFCTDLGGGGWDLSAYVSTDRLFNGHLHISRFSERVAGHQNKAWSHVIWGGVDTAKFSPGEDLSRSGVVFVGRLLPHKGVDDLIRALPVDLPAHILGPACDRRYLGDLQALAHGKRVTFTHDANDRAIVDAYRAAACVALPSVYDDMYGQHSNVPELLGQTLLEGMACGAPGLCTSVASLPEIVDDGITGFVVPPNNPEAMRTALCEITGNPSRAREMGAAARESVTSRFSWPAVVQRCLSIYELSLRAQLAPSPA